MDREHASGTVKPDNFHIDGSVPVSAGNDGGQGTVKPDNQYSGDISGEERPLPRQKGAGPRDIPGESETGVMPISIYLSAEGPHRTVEEAVERLLRHAGILISTRDEPVTGSWFRRMQASAVRAARSPAGREAALTAAHMADSRWVLAQDATVTATLMQNLGPVLTSLQPTKDAVLRIGALLVVKVDWAVAVHQLTAAQQAALDHEPYLLTSPHHVSAALGLAAPVAEPAPSETASAPTPGPERESAGER